jgi:hypothetical protein
MIAISETCILVMGHSCAGVWKSNFCYLSAKQVLIADFGPGVKRSLLAACRRCMHHVGYRSRRVSLVLGGRRFFANQSKVATQVRRF